MVHPSPPLTNSGQQHKEQWGTKVDLKPRVLNFLHINDHSLLKPLQLASDSYLILVLSESKHKKCRKDMVNMSVSLKLIQHSEQYEAFILPSSMIQWYVLAMRAANH